MLRQLIALILATGLAKVVVDTIDEASQASKDMDLLRPDVVLIDLHLRVGRGMDA
ncbi:hypothetical protein [Paraburkholderia caribensis]|uniref:hypothetical protein n=1 Tax=Paraburkholderia caribensis TaxID=75105 RepID=UPI000B2D87A7|nr:hypothetical protein [Paraburkholderia caribensis]